MFEAYSVAVRVSLINGVTSGLMNMSRAFARTHGDAKALQRTLDQIKFQVLAGAVLAGTGLFGFHLLGKTMPYAKEYARQLALMNTLGMKQAEIAKVVGEAWKTSYAVPTTTAAQNLASFRELRSAFGSDTEGQAHAAQMLPVVARLQGVMQSLTGKEQTHVGFDMVKAIELRTGVMTTEALQRNADLMSRAIIGMGGTISVSDFHGALKMGKIATNKLSDDFTYSYLPTLMQELKTAHGGGAQSAGTILMSLYQQMHGRMTKAAMPLWVEGGLVRQQDIVKTSTGQYQVKPGAVAGTGLFEQNPFFWVQQYLRPAVDRIMAKSHVSAETAINAMFSNRNAAFGAYNMYFKAAQYERDKATIGKADGGYTAYQKLLKTDPTLASQALHTQWQNILAQIGYSIMPTLVSGTLKLMEVLRDLSQWMHRHPTTVKVLTMAFAGLSATLVFSGTVLLLSAAFRAVGLAVKVFQIAKLFAIARGVTGFGAAALEFAAGAETAGAGMMALAGIISTTLVPALALVLPAVLAYQGFRYNKIVKDPGHASLPDLMSALATAKTNEQAYRDQMAKHGIDPKTGQRFVNKWVGEEGALQGEINRRTAPPAAGSPYVGTRPVPSKSSYTAGVYIDGRLVGHAIMPHMADALDRSAHTGGSDFDPGMALTPVGMRAA